jgi:mannose-1-phosphate guanylyltransferase
MTKGLIIVGGFSTRLRPITLSCPKPIIDFANKPGIVHQIEALQKAGVDEVILALLHSIDLFRSTLEPYVKKVTFPMVFINIRKLGIKITYSQESQPLGTGGCLALVKDKLQGGPFFVLNGDVFCDFPFEQLLQFHKTSGGDATILVKDVENPSQYGVVISDESGKILQFIEKPSTFVGNSINAGIYILDPRALELIQPIPTSIEKDVFPKIVKQGKMYCTKLSGFWIDIGNPKDYLLGHKLYQKYLSETTGTTITSIIVIFVFRYRLKSCFQHPDSTVEHGVEIGDNVTIGEGCIIRRGSRLDNCIIMSGTTVNEGSCITDSIVCKKCTIGKRVKWFY